uniref:Amphiphysin n=1 Tax=Stegastes partitus TaxID=144197 RepID=A0A3B5B1B1_9TELE
MFTGLKGTALNWFTSYLSDRFQFVHVNDGSSTCSRGSDGVPQGSVLQKLGKADETKDEQFEQVVVNFRRQEVRNIASINLSQSLHEVYEPDWHGKDDVLTIGKDCDALWEDFHNKLVDSTLLNLDAYLQQFPDLKTRVAKRSRKLIDYDSARHHVETLQASGMKNDRKMMKVSALCRGYTWSRCSAEDELKKAQKVFDELNVGLQDELPTLWERESAEAHEASETPTAGPAEPAEEQDKPPSAPTGGEEDELPPAPAEEEPGPPSVGEEVEEPPAPAAGEVMEEPGAPPAGGEDKETTSDSPKEEKPAVTQVNIRTLVSGEVMRVFFVLQVETMHDFEAANSDELELKRGDVVLVVPTASVEDQDAGWLTGIKESDWLTLGVGAQKGLFPDNFTQRLE